MVKKVGSPCRLSRITISILNRIQPIRTTSNNLPARVSDSKITTYNLCFNVSLCKKRLIHSFSFIRNFVLDDCGAIENRILLSLRFYSLSLQRKFYFKLFIISYPTVFYSKFSGRRQRRTHGFICRQ